MKKVDIKLSVVLGDDNIPQSITWVSDDPPSEGHEAQAKAFFLSVFDKTQLETLQIHLWDKGFEVGEMHRLTYHTLRGLADSFYRATNDPNLSNDIARFAQYMGEELGIVPKSSSQQDTDA